MDAKYKKEWALKNPDSNKKAVLKYRKTKKYLEASRKRWATPKYKQIARNCHLKRKYGVSLEAYKILNDSQNGLCAICNKPPGIKSLAVDHNHKTNKIRGLLCYKCNVSLGYLAEDINLMLKMIDYIKKYD